LKIITQNSLSDLNIKLVSISYKLDYTNIQEFCIQTLQKYNLILSEGSIDCIDYIFYIKEIEELKWYDV
jgi:hypothetical protein